MLVAWAWPAGLAATVQPAGPVASIVNVISAAVPLWSVRLKVKVVAAGPRSSGKSEVSVTLPAAASATRIDSGSVSVGAAAGRGDADRVVPRGGAVGDLDVERDARAGSSGRRRRRRP